MKQRKFWWWMQLAALLIWFSLAALAQGPAEFEGSIRDFTPASNVSGPWEITGQWSLQLKAKSAKADFSAELTMVRSDEGVTLNGGNFDDPKSRNAHTHHILLKNGSVTPITNGFQVTGSATITANGNFPPPFGGNTTLTIAVTGGNSISPSNVTLTLTGDAATHFGTQAINGVVKKSKQH